MLTRFYSPISRQVRQISAKPITVKPKIIMDEETHKMIENEELKPRKHSGRMNTNVIELPGWLPNALQVLLEDFPITSVVQDGIKLANHLNGRHAPAEKAVLQSKYAEIRKKVESKRKMQELANKSIDIFEKEAHTRSLQKLKQSLYPWAPVEYNRYAGLMYLVGRGPRDYTVLHRIFGEISSRDKEFQPKTMLDFGSGVGTAIWAASALWPKMIQEHMCVDASVEMNDLAESIISHSRPKINGVFYRQFVPLSHRRYDIVVCAYSLLELPNMENRVENIAKLWAKTGKYLVIVEQGTNAGFKMVNEARDFILHLQEARKAANPEPAYIFSPCPHHSACPRYSADDTPCNFEVRYKQLPIKHGGKPGTERFSYVVFKKGDPAEETKNWPRLVRPTLVKSRHTICRMCTADGKLEEVIFTASKHGKWMYRCAKSSRWGDRLPLELMEESETEQTEQTEQAEQTEETEEEAKK